MYFVRNRVKNDIERLKVNRWKNVLDKYYINIILNRFEIKNVLLKIKRIIL